MYYKDILSISLYRKAASGILHHFKNKNLRPRFRSRKYASGQIEELADRLRKNGYFDSDYYSRQHPEVLQSGLEPAEHFLLYGWGNYYSVSAKPVPPEFRLFLAEVCGEQDFQADLEYLVAISEPFCATLRRLIERNELEKLRLIYDDQYYRQMNQDVCSTYPVVFRHYSDIGWREQRNGSGHCSSAAYRNYMARRNIPVKSNPLFHFIEHGADFDLLKRIEEEEQNNSGKEQIPPEFVQFMATICGETDSGAIREYSTGISDPFCATLRKLIDRNELEKLRLIYDDQYYRQMNQDACSSYPVVFRHYADIGWLEQRNGSGHCSSAAYLNYMDKRNIPVNSNPLFHFIELGADFDLLKRIAKEKPKKSKPGKPQVPPEFTQFLTTICGESDFRALPEYQAAFSYKFCAVLRRLIDRNELEKLRLIYDDQYYKEMNPDVLSKFPVVFRHYSESGWREKRNGAKYCSTIAYLHYMTKRNIPVKSNPLFHFIELGADFDLLKRIEEEGRKDFILCDPSVPPEFAQFMIKICGESKFRAIPEYQTALSEKFCATLRRLIEQDRLGSLKFIYDDQYYKRTNPDVKAAFPVPFRHYADMGWQEKRKGSDHCSTTAYINYMTRRDIPVNCNPLFHFIEQGADFDLLKQIAEEEYEETILQRKYYTKYFDPDFYWAENPDIHDYFLDPQTHFDEAGYREFRHPGPRFNLSEYLFFQKSQGEIVEGNPLIDFARRKGSDKLLVQAHEYFMQAFDQMIKKLSVTQMYLPEKSRSATVLGNVPGKTAVHLHLFYYDLLPEILHYLDHIPQPFDLFISLPTVSRIRIKDLQRRINSSLSRLQKLTIIRTPNRGRDWAPLIVTFGKELLGYDYICHIHTKKSLHGKNATAQWRNHILDLLLGSSEAVDQILHMMADGTAKIIYPAPLAEIHNCDTGWDGDFAIAQDLAERYWNQDLSGFSVIDFSKGSMFWARSSAVEKLLNLPLTYEDFPQEPIPTDGTLAHALERLLLVAAVETPGQCVRLRSPSDGLDKDGFRIPAQVKKTFWNRLPSSDFPFTLYIASSAWLNVFKDRYKVHSCPVTDIIIPVYNGPEHLRRLLASLAKNTASKHRIILIDDASWETETLSLLNKFCEDRPGTLLIRNKRNLGFLPTVNRAASLCKHDFVLLNMDTEVPEKWLERLMAHLLSSEDIASVTPISNAATIYSFPEKDTNNRDWAKLFGTEEIDRIFRTMGLPHSCSIPVGVGFCMAVRKKVWDEIGPFDASAFGRGYGEEVDWCLRASRAGYRHILAENLYVGHFHGGSFSSEEKKRLCDQHQKIIERRYPEFTPALGLFNGCNCGILTLYRISALMRLLKNRNIPMVLILDHSWGGGANHFIRRRIGKLTDAGQIVCRCRPNGFWNIHAEIFCGGDKMAFNVDSLSFFFRPDSPRVTELEINSLAGWNLIPGRNNISTGFLQDFFRQIAIWKQKFKFSIIYYMHDFLPICPFYNLFDNVTNTYCDPDDKAEKCAECLLRIHPFIGSQPLPGCDILLWRKLFQDFLSDQVSRIVCFSFNTVEILQKIWDMPQFKDKISIQPHEALSNFQPVPVKPPRRPVIGVIGTLTMIKGAEIVLEFAKMIEKMDLPVSLVILGESPEVEFPRSVTVHGSFPHDDLPKLIAEYGINIAWIASIWPETFSFVRQELCQMNIPTVCFDLGAPRDYIRQWDRGAIIPEISARSVYDTVSDLFRKIYCP